MKKQDITVGGAYVVDPPGAELGRDGAYGEAPWKVKATVAEVGVPREHSTRNDGARCRLAEELRIHAYLDHSYHERTLPVGHEFVVRTGDVLRPWGPTDDAISAARVVRYALIDRVNAALDRLGVQRQINRFGDGVNVTATKVTFGTTTFDRWIARIDPLKAAEDAIEAFVEAVCSRDPWTGLRDLAADDRLEVAKAAALHEMAEGMAVSDDELVPEEDEG